MEEEEEEKEEEEEEKEEEEEEGQHLPSPQPGRTVSGRPGVIRGAQTTAAPPRLSISPAPPVARATTTPPA